MTSFHASLSRQAKPEPPSTATRSRSVSTNRNHHRPPAGPRGGKKKKSAPTPIGERSLSVEGRVEKVLERKSSAIVGTFHQEKKFRYCVPEDSRHPQSVELNPSSLDDKVQPGDVIVITLEEWNSPRSTPRGHITKILGAPDTPGLDIITIIHKHHLPTEFPESVLQQAASIPSEVIPADIERREDWRDKNVFTIDPFDAKDFDDAIAVRRLEKGGWELAVHIADVSHYVTPGTPLDKEARVRGNSTYLVDRVIPMLPESLSNGLCSLRPNVDRLTRAVIIDFDETGKPLSSRFAAAVVHSKARLTYEEAIAILEPKLGKKPSPKTKSGTPAADQPAWLVEHLHMAWNLAATLWKRRFANGALDLDMPEVKVIVDERGDAVDMVLVEYDESHQLIEEFMLAANESVARITKNRETPSVYRIHEDPDADRLFEFRELARLHGYQIGDLTNRAEIQKLLKMVCGKPEERLIKIGLLKSLKRAAYHSDPLGHYGLAKLDYTHFTSPIRRYADLIVHRVLGNVMYDLHVPHERQIREKTSVPSYAGLLEIAKHISDTERDSAGAEEESKRLKTLEFFSRLVREDSDRSFHAIILEVARIGMFVELEEFFIRGLVRRDDFPKNSDWFFDLQSQRVFGKNPKIDYQTGDEIEVRVTNLDAEKMFLDFEIA